MPKSNDVKKVEKNTKKMLDQGFVRIHPWVPENKRDEVLAYCKAARDDYFKLDRESE